MELVISDAHTGLKAAVRRVLNGVAWQRCRVHFMRNAATRLPKAAQEAVLEQLKQAFQAKDKEEALEFLTLVVPARLKCATFRLVRAKALVGGQQ